MKIATQTLKLLNDAVQRDRGTAFKENLKRVLPHIGDAYAAESAGFRTHLGASTIGQSCGRYLWYSFRWYKDEIFDGRMLRLFNRGHLEEGRFIALLLAAGIQIVQQDSKGNQFRISEFGGHYGGSCDGVGLGFPDIPEGEWALTEYKTHSEKSFEKVKKDGIKKAKVEHFVQMQTYQNKMGLNYGMYFAVNKNNDEIFSEVIETEPIIDTQFTERAKLIIFSTKPLAKINENKNWYECKYCSMYKICQGNERTTEINCRTCRYSVPEIDGSWVCRNTGEILDKAAQSKGCNSHDFIY